MRPWRGVPALALVLLLLALTGLSASAEEEKREGLQLFCYETEYLRLVYYSESHEYVVPHLVRCFENSLNFYRRLFNYTPSEKIVVLLHDFGDYGHGGTSTVPWNYMTIGLEPFDYVYETMPANERMNWLMNHELVHVVATDKAASVDESFRQSFLGKVAPTAEDPLSMIYSYLTSPRWYSPRWYHEGIAVFLETWTAGGLGRALGGYDEMVFRTMVVEDRTFYDIVGLESEGTTIDFQMGQNSYLYGTRFVIYLAQRYGPEKVLQWFDRTEGSARYFSAQFRAVYGVPLDEEWRRWIEFEQAWQRANVERIRTNPVTVEQPILERPLGSVSRPHYDAANRRILVAVNYPGKPAHIAAIGLEDGRVERLADVYGPALYYVTSLAYDPVGGKLFFTSDNGDAWRDINELDLATGRTRRLLENCRTGDLVLNPADQSLWGVQHHDGRSSIVRIPPPYAGWQILTTLPYGKDVFDLDIAPDGKSVSAAIIEINGRQRLVRLDTAKLLQGDSSYEVLYEFEDNAPENFVFSPDGRFLYGSSYYSGVSNLYRYELGTGTLEAVTNAETGYFRPLPLPGGRLFAFRYSAEGFVPVTVPDQTIEDVSAIEYLGQQVVEKYPIVTSWNAGSPARVDLDAVTRFSGEYRPLSEIRVTSLYPVVEGYRDAAAFGARMELSDPAALHSIRVTAEYSPDPELEKSERTHLMVRWNHWPWSAQALYNGTDFYDLFGPTKTSRKGTSVGAAYNNYIINDPPRMLQYGVSLAGYWGMDALPQYQNVPTTFDTFYTVSAGLGYQMLRRTIGGVDAERGLAARLGAQGTLVNGDFLVRIHLDADLGIPLPIDHSSLWLRPSVGHSFGDPMQTFSNFYFGGFGNNWVDHQAVRRYRGYDSFPGVELNEIEANDYGKLLVEWTLPPIRFRRFGVPPFYCNGAQIALFGAGIWADSGFGEGWRRVADAGLQADFKLVLFSSLESTFSLGYAWAFEHGEQISDEFMISLKLLR
jgi:hypothetical protein